MTAPRAPRPEICCLWPGTYCWGPVAQGFSLCEVSFLFCGCKSWSGPLSSHLQELPRCLPASPLVPTSVKVTFMFNNQSNSTRQIRTPHSPAQNCRASPHASKSPQWLMSPVQSALPLPRPHLPPHCPPHSTPPVLRLTTLVPMPPLRKAILHPVILSIYPALFASDTSFYGTFWDLCLFAHCQAS